MNFKKIMGITIGLFMLCTSNVYASNEPLVLSEEQELEQLQEKVDLIIQRKKEEKSNGHKAVELVGNTENEEIETRRTVVEENEPNDSPYLADRLHLDDACYGTISNEDDQDYYKIRFDESGYLYIKLSSIPNDCDYDLFFFGSEEVDRDEIDNSSNGTGEIERIYTYVTAGVNYYVLVNSFDGYDKSDEYRLVFELDTDCEEISYSVGTNYKHPTLSNNQIDTTEEAENAVEALGRMGYLNYIAKTPTYAILTSTLPGANKSVLESSVVTLHGHGAPGYMYFNYQANGNAGANQYHVAVRTTGDIVTDDVAQPKYITLKDLDLIDVRFMLFSGCQTAYTDGSSKENLARYAYKRGVETTLGWERVIDNPAAKDWNYDFMDRLRRGYTVLEAAQYADKDAWDNDLLFWKIYGNHSNVLRLSGSRSVQMDKDYENLLNWNDSIAVDVRNMEFDELEEYISDFDETFELGTYRRAIYEVGDNLYKIRYTLYLNDFDMGYGYSVLIEDNDVFRITQYGEKPLSLTKSIMQVNVTDEMIENVIEEANEELEENCTLTEQTVSKKVKDGICYLQVETNYTVMDEDGSYNGRKIYDYEIDL